MIPTNTKHEPDDIIYLKEVTKILKFKDNRRTIKWCMNNRIIIFIEEGNKRKYVMWFQFQQARLKKIIECIKVSYGDRWTEVFQAHLNNDILTILSIDESMKNLKEKRIPLSSNRYQPSDYEIEILSRLTSYNSELPSIR